MAYQSRIEISKELESVLANIIDVQEKLEWAEKLVEESAYMLVGYIDEEKVSDLIVNASRISEFRSELWEKENIPFEYKG